MTFAAGVHDACPDDLPIGARADHLIIVGTFVEIATAEREKAIDDGTTRCRHA